jgi:hypothetical protein
MWTITDKQLMQISQSMRAEFEKRVFYVLSKDDCTKELTEEDVIQNIHQQTEYLIKYQITTEESALEFLKLSFLHPVMREAFFSEILHNVFLETEDEQEKIDNLVIHLNQNDYVSEF